MNEAQTDKDVFRFREFLGLRNTVSDVSSDAEDLTTALNINITDKKRIERRKGFSAPVVDGSCHSFWTNGAVAFVVCDNVLLQILPDYSTITLLENVAPLPMAYESVGDRVFLSNGQTTYVVQDGVMRGWGIQLPPLPSVALASGSLLPGRYQFVTTYLRNDGQESGAKFAGLIDIENPSGLLFRSFGDAPSDVTGINLYLSGPNGDILYLADTLPASATVTLITTPRIPGFPLPTQFLAPPPPSDTVAYTGGCMYVGVGNMVYYSEPFAPELFDLRKNFRFDSKITMLAALEDGVFIGDEVNTYWVAGADPAKSQCIIKAPYGCIPGTVAYGGTDDYNNMASRVVYFATGGGIMRGVAGGGLENLTRARYRYPSARRGAAVLRETDGALQYLAALQG